MNELYHFGIKGMKWGVRRYQNPDGSLTPAGRRHYGVEPRKTIGERIQNWRVKRKRTKALEKARAIKADKKAQAKDREEWTRHPKLIDQHWDEFTDDEKAKALRTLAAEKSYRDFQQAKIERGKKYFTMMGNVAATVGTMIDTTNKAYNLYNTLSGNSDKQQQSSGNKTQTSKKNEERETVNPDIVGNAKPGDNSKKEKPSKSFMDEVIDVEFSERPHTDWDDIAGLLSYLPK